MLERCQMVRHNDYWIVYAAAPKDAEAPLAMTPVLNAIPDYGLLNPESLQRQCLASIGFAACACGALSRACCQL
jgi:hypothetical protein